MKYLLTTVFFLTFVFTAHAQSLDPTMSVVAPFAWLGSNPSVSATTFAVDAAYSHYASGKANLVKFISPVTQTNASTTCYARVTAETGAPTANEAMFYDGPTGANDKQRPNPGAALATSTTVSLDGITVPSWQPFAFSSVSFTKGKTYWIAFTNTTATPASNFPTYALRPQNFLAQRMIGYTTTDGNSTDPGVGSAATEPPIVCVFSDGTKLANPYVVVTAHPTTNSNDRGASFTYTAPITFWGFINSSFVTANPFTVKVYQGATLLDTLTLDGNLSINGGAVAFTNPITFAANTRYDIVLDPGANSYATAGWMDAGVNPPTDVTDSLLTSVGYVDGPTPGSYTYSQGSTTGVLLIPYNLPAPSTSSSGGSPSFFGTF